MSTVPAGVTVNDAAPRRLEHSIQGLRVRDNVTNFIYIVRVHAIIIATVCAALWFFAQQPEWGISAWWNVPAALLAIVIMGASQHQLGGATHEATHYMLFRNRRLNEWASDVLCAFPLYTTTYQYRIHHLAHHQFVNDPRRDPDIAQLRDSGHWLDFPVTHMTFLWALLRQLWIPNLIRYTATRARYSALGVHDNPYHDPQRSVSKWPTRLAVLYAVGVPVVQGRVAAWGDPLLLAVAMLGMWGIVAGVMSAIPEQRYPGARVQPVVPHRRTAQARVTFLAVLYGTLSWIELTVGYPAGLYFLLLWVVPLFTSFPLFMILRQWVQHGNGDRGRLTNTRVFLVNPLIRYAVFPFGMDYHLPHHLYASIPHYKLKALHTELMNDREYARDGVVVEGYFMSAGDGQRPSVLETLGARRDKSAQDGAYIDHHALDEADIDDPAAIAHQEELSARAGQALPPDGGD